MDTGNLIGIKRIHYAKLVKNFFNFNHRYKPNKILPNPKKTIMIVIPDTGL